MIPFNYHHLYYFYVIAQEGSISKATHKLRLAQPTLSAQLKQFENFLNTPLFLREKRTLVLTEEGHRVFSYAKMIFDIGRELKDRMVDLTRTQGRPHIQIGVTNSIPKTITETLLNYLLKIEPTVYIVLQKDHIRKLAQDLEDHVIDFILSDAPFYSHKNKDIKNHSIGKVPVVFCAHPRIARKFKKIPRSLNGAPIFLPPSSRAIFQTLQEYFTKNNVTPNIMGEIEDIEIIRRMVLRGYGIGVLNLLTVLKAPAKEKMIVLKDNFTKALCENFYIITKTRKIAHPLVSRLTEDFHIEKFI